MHWKKSKQSLEEIVRDGVRGWIPGGKDPSAHSPIFGRWKLPENCKSFLRELGAYTGGERVIGYGPGEYARFCADLSRNLMRYKKRSISLSVALSVCP
jgi:hypothetical protein